MPVTAVISKIKKGEIAPVYLLYGNEEYLQEKVVLALKETLVDTGSAPFNLTEVEGGENPIPFLVDLCNTLPVLAPQRLVIVRDCPFLCSAPKKSSAGIINEEKELPAHKIQCLLNYLANPMSSTCLLLWQKGSVPKSKKVFKAIKANKHEILEVNSPNRNELRNWLRTKAQKMGKDLEPQVIEYLLWHGGTKLRHLVNELEKLSLYSDSEKIITSAMAEKLVAKSLEGNIFALVDSLGNKKIAPALSELRHLLNLGEIPTRILYMITRQFRLIFQVKDLAQSGYTEEKMASLFKTFPFVIRKIKRQALNFSFADLERKFVLLRQYDLALKSKAASQWTLENLVIALVS